MKKLYTSFATCIVFCIFFTGCAWLGKQVDYQKACLADTECLAQAKSDAELGRTIANAAYPAAGVPVGAAILGLSLWFRGRKKKGESDVKPS